jgi:PAS domain S-box-containing protein
MTALPEEFAGRIVEGSPDAVVVCDPVGRVRYWNRGAERLFGFASVEVIGAALDLIIPERLRERHWAGWSRVMTSGETRYGEGQLLAVPALHKDGRHISIEFSIQLLKGASGQVAWVVALIRDVTERYNRDKAVRGELAALKDKTIVNSE